MDQTSRDVLANILLKCKESFRSTRLVCKRFRDLMDAEIVIQHIRCHKKSKCSLEELLANLPQIRSIETSKDWAPDPSVLELLPNHLERITFHSEECPQIGHLRRLISISLVADCDFSEIDPECFRQTRSLALEAADSQSETTLWVDISLATHLSHLEIRSMVIPPRFISNLRNHVYLQKIEFSGCWFEEESKDKDLRFPMPRLTHLTIAFNDRDTEAEYSEDVRFFFPKQLQVLHTIAMFFIE